MYSIHYIDEFDPSLLTQELTVDPSVREAMEQENQWWTLLEASIRREGIRNPVCITQKPEEIEVRYGGSRLWIAKKLGITAPAIVADFTDRWSHCPQASVEDPTTWIRAWFKDQPKKIIFKPHGINISGCADVHLDS